MDTPLFIPPLLAIALGLSPSAILTLVLALLVVVVFASGRVGLDAIGLLLIGILVQAGVLTFEQGVAGLASNPVLTIAGLYVLGEGLTRTGAVQFLAQLVLRRSGGEPVRLLLWTGVVVAAVSAFLNNTAVVVIFIPILLGVAGRTGIAASHLMMPLAFGSLLGGMCTLVGTSTNLLVSGIAKQSGVSELGMFDLTPIGVPMAIAGIVFMALFARRLLPERSSLSSTLGPQTPREYVTEMRIGAASSLVGKPYSSAFEGLGARLVFRVRNEEMLWPPFRDDTVQAGDVVMLKGQVEDLSDTHVRLDMSFLQDVGVDPRVLRFFEIAIAPRSLLVGQRVGSLRLQRDYGATAVAVLRAGAHIHDRASKLLIRPGDVLLVCGDDQSRARLRESIDFYLLAGSEEGRAPLLRRGRRALIVGGLVMLGFGVDAFVPGGLMPTSFVALFGALAMVAVGCLSPRAAYRAIDWTILIFLAGSMALGQAMKETGAAQAVASLAVEHAHGLSPALLASLFVLSCIIVNLFVSQAAVATVFTPIALSAAVAYSDAFGLALDDPVRGALLKGLLLAVCVGGSIGFASPMGHQVNLMVFGPGGYRYSDYLRLGLPLSLICWIVASFMIPVVTGLSWSVP